MSDAKRAPEIVPAKNGKPAYFAPWYEDKNGNVIDPPPEAKK
jgi:hypothetical protein